MFFKVFSIFYRISLCQETNVLLGNYSMCYNATLSPFNCQIQLYIPHLVIFIIFTIILSLLLFGIFYLANFVFPIFRHSV